MSKKKTLIIGLSIIAVCLIAAGIGIYRNRSTKREATPQELEEYAPYTVDWKALPQAGADSSEKEIILSMCSSVGEKKVGNNTYAAYTSDEMGNFLYRFSELTEIFTGENEVLFLSYTDTEGRTVILAYDDTGLCERGIYNPADDTFFHELEGSVEVWEKFTTGIHW